MNGVSILKKREETRDGAERTQISNPASNKSLRGERAATARRDGQLITNHVAAEVLPYEKTARGSHRVEQWPV